MDHAGVDVRRLRGRSRRGLVPISQAAEAARGRGDGRTSERRAGRSNSRQSIIRCLSQEKSVVIMVNAESTINRLTGEWSVSMKFSMEGGSVAKGRGTAVGRSIALGRGVQIVLKGNLEGVGTYEDNSLVAYDQEEDAICLFTVTSMGVVHSRTGRYQGDNTLVMRWSGRLRGRPAEEEITVSLFSEDEFALRQVVRVDGGIVTIGEYQYKRSGRGVLEEPVPTFA